MQVYTTIYLAETLDAGSQRPEPSLGDFEAKRGLLPIKRTSLEYISVLEARNWFLDDPASED